MTKIFKPMLAATLNDVSELEYPVLASPKLDGIRTIAREGQIVSRNLKPIRNKFIQSELAVISHSGFDGELIVGASTEDKEEGSVFRRTTSGVMSEDGEPDFTFYVFDIVNDTGTGFHTRFTFTALSVLDLKHPRIKMVKHEWITDEEELRAFEQKCLDEGYEGVMLRSVNGPYKFGRSTVKEGDLFKLKRFKDAEAVITGFQERMHNANPKTTNALGESERSTHKENLIGRGDLGALECLYNGVPITVGAGFTDQLRQHIWDYQARYIGKTIVIKFFDYGQYEVPRFPVFKGFRDVNDIS